MSNYSMEHYLCSDKGLLLPAINEYTWNKGTRAFLYLLGLLWCFLGIAIASDTFMCGIEHITSKTRLISIPNPDGNGVKVIEVKVWNDTVANLTLLAFGTSAPEILLSVIEICGHAFVAGELGPGTIVGSAAFNLFVITAVCIVSIPKGETRRIKNHLVFATTTASGIFAYVWLILVLVVITPEVVELWEAIVTLLMFPMLILLAYAADKRICWRRSQISSEVEIGFNLDKTGPGVSGTAEIMEVARELAKDHRINEDEAARVMAAKIAEETPKPSGWYRVQATRLLSGGARLIPRTSKEFEQVSCYICAISKIFLLRSRIETIDGTAEAESDYRPIRQLLTFKAGEKTKDIYIEIINDDVWEPDEFFFVKLFHHPAGSTENEVTIGKLSINQVTIVNDDEPGRLEFSKPSYIVKESSGSAQLTINRVNGADGEVKVSWKTQDLSARSGHDYVGAEGTVLFKHGETSKIISIDILGISERTHEPNFQVELRNATGGAQIGRIPKTIVTIINDEEFNNMLSRIANKTQKNLDGLKLDTSTWSQQFRRAMNVNGGDQDGATCLDYVMHFMTFFWKVLFAVIPPPSYCGGWLTFWLSLAAIGMVTAIVSDLASVFGCLVGLSDYITAITFVALGTSMPDTF
ncbi:unnamed protein product, partial [Candidula unifasciata]